MDFLRKYIYQRPPHLSLIRSAELKIYQKYLPLEGPLLDVGCGDGFFLKILIGNQKNKPKITGADVSKKAIQQAYKTNLYENLIQLKSSQLPFAKNSYQTIISNCVFEHIPPSRLKILMKELHRVLKKDGILLTTVATNQFTNFLFFNFIPGYKAFFNKISDHHSLLSKQEWQKLFEKSDFEITKLKSYLTNKKLMHLFDVSHWLGAPYLISHKLTGNWNPNILKFYTNMWYKIFSSSNKFNQNKKKSPYLFFGLKKISI